MQSLLPVQKFKDPNLADVLDMLSRQRNKYRAETFEGASYVAWQQGSNAILVH